MNPPAKASIENRTESRRTTRPRSPEAEAAAGLVSSAARLGSGCGLDAWTEPNAAGGHRDADQRVPDDDRAVGIGVGQPAVEERLAHETREQRATRRRDVADEVVPGERGGSPGAIDGLGQCRLLDGKERADLVAGRRDDPDRRCDDQERRPAGERERHAGADHQQATHEEHAASSDPIGMRRQPERDQRVADEREREDRPDGEGVQPERVEVQHEDHGQEAVAEHPERPDQEQQPAVAIETSQAGEQTRLDRVRWCRHGQRV